ncbi:hypothetical protein L1887_09948 [Cichorium endivia]|nr:hypothetical protein L1887_09948 [Cichorium endivia]
MISTSPTLSVKFLLLYINHIELFYPICGAIYIPCVVSTLNSVGTPTSIHLLFYVILFENVMSLHRTKGTFIGLLDAKRSTE